MMKFKLNYGKGPLNEVKDKSNCKLIKGGNNMAVDGIFDISIKIPTGEQKSKLVLKTEGNTLTGTLESPAGVNPLQNGVVKGDEIEFQFDAKAPTGQTLKVTVKGTIKGDTLTGNVSSPLGQVPITGKKVG